MNFKKYIAPLSFTGCAFLCLNYTVLKTSGSHPGSTGAPLEKTCGQKTCHDDASIIVDPVGINLLNFSSVDSTYLPGQTYTITVQVQKTGVSKFGFELVAIKDNDSTNVGAFTITDPVRTQLLSSIAPNGVRTSVTHQTAGTPSLSSGATQWSFNWIAPATNQGPITFYYATNCTDNDGTNDGDSIYISSFKIRENGAIYVKEYGAEFDLKTYYDESAKEIIISYRLIGNHDVKILLYENSGKMIDQTPTLKRSGINKEKITLPSDHTKGTYLVQLIVDNRSTNKKVIIH